EGSEVEHDVEGEAPVLPPEQVRDEDQVPGGGHRDELGQPLHDAEQDGLQPGGDHCGGSRTGRGGEGTGETVGPPCGPHRSGLQAPVGGAAWDPTRWPAASAATTGATSWWSSTTSATGRVPSPVTCSTWRLRATGTPSVASPASAHRSTKLPPSTAHVGSSGI